MEKKFSQKEYDKAHTKQIKLKLNLETDHAILEWLTNKNKQGTIKDLIREEMYAEYIANLPENEREIEWKSYIEMKEVKLKK